NKTGLAVPIEGMDIMRRLPGRYLSSLLASPALMLGVAPGVAAQDSHDHADAQEHAAPSSLSKVRWSDPAAWPDGKVPGEGDAVTIARDKEVVLDVSPPALRSVTVEGKLTFADERDLDLVTDW